MDSRTQKPSQPHYIINLATFLSQKEPTDSADEALYLGFDDDKLETYALPDGKLVGSITSNLAPVAIIPGTRLYFGLRLESAENGELMLSSLEHGRPIESVCESFWHRSPIFIFDSNRGAAFLTVKAKAQLIRAVGNDEANSRLQAPLTRTLAWTYSHLNDSERKTLLATKLADAEKQFEDGNQQEAITTVLGLLREDENGNITSIVRDYYGRSMQWQLALETSTGMSSGFHEAFHLMLLYQCNRIEEYLKTRKTILSANSDSIQDPYLHTMLIACLLMPLEQDEHDGIKSLAKRIAKGRESWELAMVGKSMYRLGRYIQWHESPSRDPKHPTNPILHAFAKYQQDPSDVNRKACEDYLGIVNKKIQEGIKKKNTGRWWHNFVEDIGLATEAKRLLSQAKPSAND